jgi:hypothetical protein
MLPTAANASQPSHTVLDFSRWQFAFIGGAPFFVRCSPGRTVLDAVIASSHPWVPLPSGADDTNHALEVGV